MLVPTWLQFPSKNNPISNNEMNPKGTNIRIVFCTNVASCWLRLGRSNRDHVGHIFDQKGAIELEALPFWVAGCVLVLSDFSPSWPDRGSILPRQIGSMFKFGAPFLMPCSPHVGAFGRKSWSFMGWWRYAKRKDLIDCWSDCSI